MKKKELDAQLRAVGWWKLRDGGKHEKWTNGDMMTMLPRHKEINEYTAKSILKIAQQNPGGGKK